MSYLASADITVFPTANRNSTYRRDSRAFTEVTVTDIRKEITDSSSYIVSCERDTNKTGIVDWNATISGKDMIFVIGGYRFSAASTTLRTAAITLGGADLYANITVTDGMISGTDLNKQYTGVELLSTASGTDSLKLLHKDNDVWYIPTGSYSKNNDSVSKIELDGGYFNYTGAGTRTGYDLNNNPIQS